VLGIAAAIQALVGWRANDRAVRAGEDLPAPALRVYVAVGVVVVAIAVVVGLFVA
jgi:putative membrane protein